MANYTISSSNHGEWLKSREGGVGSSEVATLLGVNPYQTPYQLWLEKTGQVNTGEKENFLMKAGHYLEDAISHFCADAAGLTIIKSSASEFVVVNREKQFLRASPDRYAWLPNAKRSHDNKVIIECKSTQKSVDPDNISKYWFCQVMYQLGITELDRAYLAWLTQGRDFDYKVIEFDKDFFEYMVEQVERFWVDCVLGGREPELVSVNDVLLKYPRQEEGKRAYATQELLERWSALKDINAEIKRLTEEKSSIEDEFKKAMLGAEGLYLPATKDAPERALATWKATKASKKFDMDSFMKDEPETYAKYLREVDGTRRFSLK